MHATVLSSRLLTLYSLLQRFASNLVSRQSRAAGERGVDKQPPAAYRARGHFVDLGDLPPRIYSMERKPVRGFILLVDGLACGGPLDDGFAHL
ncbi:hypothetical protein M1O17_05425, partial [Dehalococcoidia bacterium]|nr:hypothetical protein [Dehalococcoidia bacterium]